MVDKIEKALNKFTQKEKKEVKDILIKFQKGDVKNLDIKKLKGHNNIFRVRKGKIRIIFRKKGDAIFVLSVERRTDKTYKDL